MPIAYTDLERVYKGNDVSYRFPVPYMFLDTSHIKVVQRDSEYVETPLVEGTDYEVEQNTTTLTGVVVLAEPLSSDYTLAVTREVPLTRTVETPDPFDAPGFTQELDKLIILAQQVNAILDSRVIKMGYLNCDEGKPENVLTSQGTYGLLVDLDGKVIGVDVQAFSALLSLFAGSVAADLYHYFNAAGTLTTGTVTATGRNVLAHTVTMYSDFAELYFNGTAVSNGIISSAGLTLLAQVLGTANSVWRVNAAEDAYECVSENYDMASVDIDLSAASGTTTVSGLAFKPSVLLALGYATDAAKQMWCVGAAIGTGTQVFMCHRADDIMDVNTGSFIGLQSANEWWHVWSLATITADGCTITHTKTGSPTGTGKLKLLFFR